jgi:gliding motility-associated-like protein
LVPNPVATPPFTISYTANVTNVVCPYATSSVTINVIPEVPVTATAVPTLILQNSQSNISAQFQGPGTVNYTWAPPDDLDCPTCQNTIAHPMVTTTYTVTVDYTVAGVTCTTIDTVTIKVIDKCDPAQLLYIPNTFTPNDDGVNDIFKIRSFVIDELHYFRIYNRWGELMFETKDVNQGWDGTFRGQKLNSGVYVYTAEVVCVNGDVVFLKGNITLLR